MISLGATTELLGTLGDASRIRLLALLEAEELSVAELVTLTGLTQSRVSTHLGRLREAGLLRVRRAGASALYGVEPNPPAAAANLWRLLRAGLTDAVVTEDAERLRELLASRRGAFPESVAGEMERHYSPGRTWEGFAHGLAALLDLGDVLDVGSGDGAVAKLLAPNARRVVCLDHSERLIDAARRRLAHAAHVDCVVGDMHQLPFPAGSFDRVALLNVLAYSRTPARVLAEAARVLRPSGAVVVQALRQHAHMDLAARYGHVHPGFQPAELTLHLEDAGLEVARVDTAARERRSPHFELLIALARKPSTSPAHGRQRTDRS